MKQKNKPSVTKMNKQQKLDLLELYEDLDLDQMNQLYMMQKETIPWQIKRSIFIMMGLKQLYKDKYQKHTYPWIVLGNQNPYGNKTSD